MPTFILIHGFTGFVGEGVVQPLHEQAKAFQKRYPKANVVVVRWEVPVGNNFTAYGEQVTKSPEIGAEIAKWMQERRLQPAKTVISAHSPGAHIAAFASNSCKNSLGDRV